MLIKEKFSSEQWDLLLKSPTIIISAVAIADGIFDNFEETAINKILEKGSNFSNPILAEVFKDLKEKNIFPYKRIYGSDEKIRQDFNTIIQILDEKVGVETSIVYRKYLIALGCYVAEASGSPISYRTSLAEVEVLSRMAFYLGVSEMNLQEKPTLNELINTIETELNT